MASEQHSETWALSALKACLRQSDEKTKRFTNQDLLKNELATIINKTKSKGKTPDRTLSRTLQELRDQGFIKFLGRGEYILQQFKIQLDRLFQRTMSKGEKLVANLLRELDIPFEQEKTFQDLKHKGFLRFDFVFEVQNRKFAIEFNGVQHYRPIDYFGGQIAFEDLKVRDQLKRDYCQANDIELIYVTTLNPQKVRKEVALAIYTKLSGTREGRLRELRPVNYKE
jgi:hypothetical protein